MHNRALLAWLHDPRGDHGIRFAQANDNWDFWGYPRLASLACRAAWGLLESGVREGDVICFIFRSGPEFVATLFGAMLAGCIPSPVAPEMAFQDTSLYAEHLSGVFETARPSRVVTHRDLLSSLPDSVKKTGSYQVLVFDELVDQIDQAPELPNRRLADLAMLQYTSGSTTHCRGVKVPFEALETNVQAIRHWLRWTEDDPFASWLPLHHDMGLVGALICSVVGNSDLWLLQSEHFVRRPLRYLECFGKFGATLTTTATFGLDYILRKVQPNALEGLDFSGWKGMVVGADRIDARTLDRFFNLLSPFGFQRRVLLPGYGMAEATLAVTGLPLEEEWSAVTVAASSLSLGEKVAITRTPKDGHMVVGCGRTLDGVEIVVTDDEDHPLPDLTVGEIVVRGASVAAGYVQQHDVSILTQLSKGVLRTGDAGFMVDGQLFVLGRLGDSMKVRGCVVFGEDLEVALAGIGVPRERVAALLGTHKNTATAVVVFERFQTHWQAEAEAIIRRFAPEASVVLVDAPRGTILRTSSGKPKRRLLWRAFVNGTLDGNVIEREPANSPVER